MALQKQVAVFEPAQSGTLKSGILGTITVLPHRVIALHEAAAAVGAARKQLHLLTGGASPTTSEHEKAGVLGELLVLHALEAAGVKHRAGALVALKSAPDADLLIATHAGRASAEIKTTNAVGRRVRYALINERQRLAMRADYYILVLLTADDSAVLVLQTAGDVAAWPLLDGSAASGPGANACYARNPARAALWDDLLAAPEYAEAA